jgi:nucleotide-binding universal stress UspA family protein
MKKILVPVDFSGHTDIACTYAIELAGTEGALIHLFHAYSDQFIIAETSFPEAIEISTMYNEELLKEVFHQSEKKMEALKAKLEEKLRKNNLNDIKIENSVTGGEIESEMSELIEAFKPDIVVMGTRGAGKTISMWGRVSTHIINHSRIPVLTVPKIKKFKGFKNIMLAADLSGRDEVLIRKLFSIFNEFTFHLSCIHFLIKEDIVEQNEHLITLRKTFQKEEKAGRISFRIVEVTDDKQTVINQFIDSESIDLIAFQPHKHSIFYALFSKKITRKNLVATNMPLLALPICE